MRPRAASMLLVRLSPIDCAESLFAVRRHGSDGVLGTACTLLLRGCDPWPGMIEDPEPIVVGQIDQATAGILKDAGDAGKRLEHFGVRRIAEVKNFYGFGWALRIPDDPFRVFVRNFGEADVGTYDFEFAGGGVAGLGAMIHQTGEHRFAHIDYGKALLGCLLDIQVLFVSLILQNHLTP